MSSGAARKMKRVKGVEPKNDDFHDEEKEKEETKKEEENERRG